MALLAASKISATNSSDKSAGANSAPQEPEGMPAAKWLPPHFYLNLSAIAREGTAN